MKFSLAGFLPDIYVNFINNDKIRANKMLHTELKQRLLLRLEGDLESLASGEAFHVLIR